MQPSSNGNGNSLSSPTIGGALPSSSAAASDPSSSTIGTTAASSAAQRRPYLYVGQLSPHVHDGVLKEVFGSIGQVLSTKIVFDRNSGNGGYNYGFVEYADVHAAETALKTFDGQRLFDSEIRVDWAASSLSSTTGDSSGILGKENTSQHFHVFVGDLAPEVNDAVLRQAFERFPSTSEARVMWDVSSGKSRGYGFVAFREKSDAEQAMSTMNGEFLGSRAIRVNWANQKGQSLNPFASGAAAPRSSAMIAALGGMAGLGVGPTSMPPTSGAASGAAPLSYDQVLAASPPHNTTIYVGNIPPFATQNDLVPLFQQFGYIIEVRMQSDRGFAFIKLDSHENAANAIVNLAGQIACGRPMKCGWGKDRNESAMLNALRQGMQLSGYGSVAGPHAVFGLPQYGFPGGFTYGAAPGTTTLDAASIQQMQAAQASLQAHHALQPEGQHPASHQQQQQHHQQQQQQQHQQHLQGGLSGFQSGM